jgi:hypothetical protein
MRENLYATSPAVILAHAERLASIVLAGQSPDAAATTLSQASGADGSESHRQAVWQSSMPRLSV